MSRDDAMPLDGLSLLVLMRWGLRMRLREQIWESHGYWAWDLSLASDRGE